MPCMASQQNEARERMRHNRDMSVAETGYATVLLCQPWYLQDTKQQGGWNTAEATLWPRVFLCLLECSLCPLSQPMCGLTSDACSPSLRCHSARLRVPLTRYVPYTSVRRGPP